MPKNWEHPQKEFLKDWYSKRGFNHYGDCAFEEIYPSHKQYMKCILVFKNTINLYDY